MKVLKTFVGWAVILIILWLLFTPSMVDSHTGFGEALFLSFASLMQLFILSIVCTLGISLIVWIPLGLGVGHIVFAIFGGGDKEPEVKAESAVSLPRDKQALVNYVKKAKAKGLTDEEIIVSLRNNGWIASDIMWAFMVLK